MLERASSNLATNIKRLRERRGLTQKELADASGVPRPTIANLESGVANPTLSVLLKVAASLGAVVEELVSATPEAQLHKAKSLPEKRRRGAAVRRLIADDIRPTEFERVELAPGARFGSRAVGSGAREYFAVEAGEIAVISAGDVLRLGAGDVATLVADRPRDYTNQGRRIAVAYRIVATSRAGG